MVDDAGGLGRAVVAVVEVLDVVDGEVSSVVVGGGSEAACASLVGAGAATVVAAVGPGVLPELHPATTARITAARNRDLSPTMGP